MNNFETKVDGAAGKSGRGFSAWMMAVLLVMTVGLYWPATRCDFVNYDDSEYVTENPNVQGGLTWKGMKWAFLNPVNGNWHPLTTLSHMLDCQVFGLKPWGHHLTNVLLHGVNTVLLFLSAPSDNRCNLAKHDRGGTVWAAPGACGIGGVGGGA